MDILIFGPVLWHSFIIHHISMLFQKGKVFVMHWAMASYWQHYPEVIVLKAKFPEVMSCNVCKPHSCDHLTAKAGVDGTNGVTTQ